MNNEHSWLAPAKASSLESLQPVFPERRNVIATKRLSIKTAGEGQVIDIHKDVLAFVHESKVREGQVTVFVTATTASVTAVEYEPGLQIDLKTALERLFPRGIPYQHNILNNDTNGHSHTQATFIGPSLVIPISAGQPTLGTWQRIVLIDFDSRPRERQVVVQVFGE